MCVRIPLVGNRWFRRRHRAPLRAAGYRKPDAQNPIKRFGPMEAHPDAVQDVLVLARRAGIIPEEWVADTRAPDPLTVATFDDADEFAKTVARWAEDFRLDVQRNQPVYIELLVEAAGLQERIARIAHDYGVPVYSGAGFDGLKGKRAIADRAKRREFPTVVLNIGDRDKKGGEIYIAAGEDAVAWAGGIGHVIPPDHPNPDAETDRLITRIAEKIPGHPFLIFRRIALTTKQATDLGLLDSKGKAEVDGVPVPVMDQWVKDAIEALQDPTRRDEVLAEEEQERKRLPDAIRDALNDRDAPDE